HERLKGGADHPNAHRVLTGDAEQRIPRLAQLANVAAPSLWAVIRSPCSSTSRFISVSPMPNPECLRSKDRSTWVERSKMRGGTSLKSIAHGSLNLVAVASGAEAEVLRSASVVQW